jgi:hypothetical protein
LFRKSILFLYLYLYVAALYVLSQRLTLSTKGVISRPLMRSK